MKYYSLLIISLLYSFKAFGQWTQVTPVSGYVQTVFFTSNDTGYVGTGSSPGAILKTTDGGINWNVQWSGGSNFNVTSIYFINQDTGFAVGYTGSVFVTIVKTTDAGLTWSTVYSANSAAGLSSVFFVNSNIGYVVGNNSILKTTDGGLNWNSQSPGVSSWLHSVFFVNSDTGFAAGSNWSIIKTINGGTNWTLTTSGSGPFTYHSLFFTDSVTGYAVGYQSTGPISNSPVIQKTINGGTNWSFQSSSSLYKLNGVFFTSPTTGYIIGDGGNIQRTDDGGINWVNQNSNTSSRLFSIHFTDSLIGYASGLSTILKTTNGGVTGINASFANVPLSVHPNPANSKLIITSEINLTNIKVQISNVLGQVTVEEKYQNLNNTIELDISKINNGIYFLSLIQGEQTKVYKIIIQH